jgi:hypothetical protein
MQSDQLQEIAAILARGFLRNQNRRTLQAADTPSQDSLACVAEQSVHVNAVG